jgi:hypothetical protein
LSDIILAFLGVAWIGLLPIQNHIKITPGIVLSFTIFYIAFIGCELMGFSLEGLESDVQGFLKILIAYFVFPYLVADITKTYYNALNVIISYIGMAVVNVLVSILDGMKYTNFQSWLHVETVNDWAYDTRFHGLAMHPNHLGQLCAIAATLAIAVIPAKKLSWRMALWGLSEIVLIIGIIGSGSRAALLSFGTVGLIWSLLYWRALFKKPSSFIVMIVVLIISGLTFFHIKKNVENTNALARLFGDDKGVEQSNQGRLLDFKVAIEEFSESPIVGAGFSYIGGVENIVIQFMQSAGLLGIIGILLYFYPIADIKNIRMALRNRMILGCMSGLAVFLIFTQMVNLTYARFSLIPMGLL